MESHWLTFEAGARPKAIKGALVIPYRFQLREADVGQPIAQFQSGDGNEISTFKLVHSINSDLRKPLGDHRRTFEQWWHDLHKVRGRFPHCATRDLLR